MCCIQVEAKLAWRLEEGLKAWTLALRQQEEEQMDLDMDTDAPIQTSHKPGGEPKIKVYYMHFVLV